MVPELERYLLESALAAPLAVKKRGDLSFIVEKSHNKSLVYIFAHGMERPAFFAKMTSVTYKVELLRHEHELLSQLASILPGEAGGSLPKALAFQTLPGGGAFSIQTALEGLPMSCYMGSFWNPFWRRKAEANFKIATNWLINLGKCTLSRKPRTANFRPGAAAENKTDSVWDGPFSVACHADFSPQHLLIGSRGLGVIDWEHGSWCGPPALDLFNFALRYMALMRKTPDAFSGHHEKLTVLSVFFDENRLSTVFAHSAAEYCSALGIKSGVLKELSRFYLNSLGGDFQELHKEFEKKSVL